MSKSTPNRPESKEDTMSSRRFKTLLVAVVVTAVTGAVLAGTGLARTPVEPSAPGDFLYGRVLDSHELYGFYAITCPAVTRSSEEWSAQTGDRVQNGFVAGLDEELLSKTSHAHASSLAVLFRTAADARAQVDQVDGARFSVAGIPGAHGHQSTSRVTVAFSVGRLEYVVRVTADPVQLGMLRGRAVAAARALYRRLDSR
jgi:hypothetical protein